VVILHMRPGLASASLFGTTPFESRDSMADSHWRGGCLTVLGIDTRVVDVIVIDRS